MDKCSRPFSKPGSGDTVPSVEHSRLFRNRRFPFHSENTFDNQRFAAERLTAEPLAVRVLPRILLLRELGKHTIRKELQNPRQRAFHRNHSRILACGDRDLPAYSCNAFGRLEPLLYAEALRSEFGQPLRQAREPSPTGKCEPSSRERQELNSSVSE